MWVLPVLVFFLSQKECLIPLKKETEDEKSPKIQKKRKVSVVVPALSKNSQWALSVDVTLHDQIFVCQKKKKTITDVLSSSEPKPGCPADLQNLVTQYFSDKMSVIEQEELRLLGESGQVPLWVQW